ncbi:MAG: cell division protein FtsQ [Geobacteraceae bacterium GWC2_48_7]|nr:MAG: cell division protein FtsQ [Geobacteraceae bacterium GWC2_48_7]
MRDFSSPYQRKKVTANKTKVQRKPLNPEKYLRPLAVIALGMAGVALLVTVMFVSYRAINKTTFFRLKNIEVSATKKISREDILASAGISPGNDLLRMNLKLLGEQLARNPWVETVQINRYFPDRLAILVTEREPLALVNMGFVYYLDKKGTIFKALSQGDKLDYPVLTGFSEEALTGDPSGTKDALLQACELLKVLQQKGPMMLADLSEIHYEKGYGFTLFSTSGALQVKVGSGDFLPRIERFAKVYNELMGQRSTLRSIDLDYNDKIVVKKINDVISDTGRGIHVSNKKG